MNDQTPASRSTSIRLGAVDSLGVGIGIFPLGVALGFLVIQAGLPWWLAPALSIPLAVVACIATGSLCGFINGKISTYWRIPSFIVTLGGLLIWRGATWFVTSGRTVAPMDATFRLMGGGTEGSIGATASWMLWEMVWASSDH